MHAGDQRRGCMIVTGDLYTSDRQSFSHRAFSRNIRWTSGSRLLFSGIKSAAVAAGAESPALPHTRNVQSLSSGIRTHMKSPAHRPNAHTYRHRDTQTCFNVLSRCCSKLGLVRSGEDSNQQNRGRPFLRICFASQRTHT